VYKKIAVLKIRREININKKNPIFCDKGLKYGFCMVFRKYSSLDSASAITP